MNEGSRGPCWKGYNEEKGDRMVSPQSLKMKESSNTIKSSKIVRT